VPASASPSSPERGAQVGDEVPERRLVLARPVEVHARDDVVRELDPAERQQVPRSGERMHEQPLVVVALALHGLLRHVHAKLRGQRLRISEKPALDARVRAGDDRSHAAGAIDRSIDGLARHVPAAAVGVDGDDDGVRQAGLVAV
jgi:hypothetical protein